MNIFDSLIIFDSLTKVEKEFIQKKFWDYGQGDVVWEEPCPSKKEGEEVYSIEKSLIEKGAIKGPYVSYEANQNYYRKFVISEELSRLFSISPKFTL